MSASARRGVATRRLYRFENLSSAISHYANQQRSEQFLREFAGRLWQKHGRKGRRCPTIVVTDGAPWSSCTGCSQIELATATGTRNHKPQNTIGVLLHELTHALGFGTHGPGFVRKYFELLAEYGRCEHPPLLLDAKLHNLKV